MEDIENIKNELEEIKTARDNIKTALENEGETVTNDIRTYATAIPNVNKVKTVNHVEADTNKNIQIDASKINVDDTAETKQNIKTFIETLRSDVDSISVPEYSVIETTVTEGYSKTYSLTKDGTEVGVKINIPKDLVVNKGTVKVVATAGTPYEGAAVGDKYLDIELNDPTKDHIYIPVKELVDVYSGKNNDKVHVVIGNDNSIEAQIQTGSIEETDLAQGLQDKINATISLEDYGIFRWDGKSTTENPDNLTMWQKALDYGENSTAMVLCKAPDGSAYKKNGIILINSMVRESVKGKTNYTIGSSYPINFESRITNNLGSHEIWNDIRLSITVSEDYQVQSATKSSNWDYSSPYFLPTNSTSIINYTPTYEYHPATKKYVDDNKYTTKTKTYKVEADKAAGFTYDFGYKCDDLMVFLNGEKLVGKTLDTQTTDDYSYTKIMTGTKCTAIQFTSDFTIITGDVIDLVLANPEQV